MVLVECAVIGMNFSIENNLLSPQPKPKYLEYLF